MIKGILKMVFEYGTLIDGLGSWMEGISTSISNVDTTWKVIFGGAALVFFIMFIAMRRK